MRKETQMDFRDVVRSGLEEYTQHLKRAVEGLSPAELRWQPSLNSNHINWLVWHIARVEDNWMNSRIANTDTVWTSGGWRDRFGVESEAGGYGDTVEIVASFPQIEMADLLAYLDAVRQRTLQVLGNLTDDDLATTRAAPRREPKTVTWILGHVLTENSQHVGQIAYIRGLIRGINA
jgi:uncharacterized damage-inducible protein DinB